MRINLRILALITFITVINYFDRSAISFAIQPIEQSLGLTNLDFGWIASGFSIGYLAVAVVGGILVDRIGPVILWPVSAVIWSGVTMAMGMAHEFTSLFVLRILLGFAEGMHFPCLLKTIMDYLPPSYRVRSLAIGLFGVPLATVIGSPFISWLIDAFGWHKMFYVLGILGFIWAALWAMCFRGRPKPSFQHHHLTGENTLLFEKGIPWKQILHSHSFQISCFIFFVFGYITFFALMWLPGFLEQTYATNIRATGYLVILPWIVSAVLLIMGGSISDRLLHITHDLRKSRSYIIGIGMALSGIAFLGVALVDSLALDLLFLSLGLGCAFATNAPIYALNGDLFHKHAGTAQGVMGLFFALAGIVAPALTGGLVELTGNFQIAFYLVGALALVAAILALFSQHPQELFKSDHESN